MKPEAIKLVKRSRQDSGSRLRPSRLRILFSCIGRRIQLLRAFQNAARELEIDLTIHGSDANRHAPGMQLVDKPHLVPKIADSGFVASLISLVEREKIQLLVPLLDTELPKLADAADRFADVGCRVLISTPEVVSTCRDKLATHEVLSTAGVDTPVTWTWHELLTRKRHKFPYYMKPRFGSAGVGNFVIRNRTELQTFGQRVPEPIVQECVQGTEYTVDVYCGLDGKPRCAVPRRRLEVRSGEVSKAITVREPAVMAVALRVAHVLDGCRGVVTVQCMAEADGRIRVIEINPRFGGGVPLSIHAGADFPKWILMELLGQKPRIRPGSFRDGVMMLRYDDAVFVENGKKLLRSDVE